MEKVKIAVIGVGSIAGVHIDAYLKNPDVEIVAFCDINEEQLKKMSEKYSIERCFTDMDTMLAEMPEIDAVSVCTWNSAHAPCTIKALNAGKHVLCEKPTAMNTQQALEMQEAAEKSGKLLMIGFVRRYGNDCNIMKDFIEQDYFGDFYYAKATYLRRNGNPGGWFGDKSRSGGGPLIDIGVHVIDLARYLMGNNKAVSVYGATYQKLFDRKNLKSAKIYNSVSAGKDDVCDVEDFVSAMIRFENGAVLHVEASFSLNIEKDESNLQFYGTKGGAKLSPELTMYTEINDYMADVKLASETALSFDGLFENEINHYVECIQGKAECRSPIKDGVEIMRILDAVYESAEKGHEIILK